MAKKYLSDDEVFGTTTSYLSDEEVFGAPARSAGGGRGFVNPPLIGQPQPTYPAAARAPALAPEPIDYGDAATDMMGTPATPPAQGLIQRIGQALRPEPKSLLDQPYTPTPEEAQAERDRRLSYGAGPIRPEVLTQADRVRSTRGTDAPARPATATVARVAQAMDARGEESSADILRRINTPANQAAATQAKAEEFRSLGEWAVDSLSGVAQGFVSLAQLPTNIIAPGSSLAESLRETQKELQAQESDVAKASREVLRRRVESEDGFLGKYFATVKELVTNPTLSVTEALKQIPMFVAVVGGAKLGSAVGGAGVAAAGRAAPSVALADAIGGGALTTAARATGAAVGGVASNMVMTAGDAAGNTYETLTDKSKTPLSEWRKNPDFQKLVAEGKTEQDAIQEIATTKARMAALITAPLGVLGFMGAEAAVVNRGLGRAAADAMTLRGAAKLVGKDVGLEQLEEGGTQLGSNVATRTINPNQSLMEGVPEAMATAAVTSTPFGVLGAYSQYKAAQEQGQQADPVADYLARTTPGARDAAPEFISPEQTVRRPTDVGPSPLAPGVANFTPPGSPTKQAGMVDIVVPLPGAPGEETPAVPGTINPTTEQQFGLDKLRMGGTNVGAVGVPGGLAGEGGGAGSGLIGGSMGLAGPGNAGAAGPGGGLAGVPGANDRQAVPAGGAAGQPAASVAPAKIWAGRAGDGYAQPQDAQQALPGLQRKYPDLTWNLQQDADGKFFWAGATKGANLETTATPTGGAQGQEVAAAGAAAGAGQAGAASLGAAAAPGAAAAAQLPGLESAGLRAAPTAPVGEIKKLNTALSSEIGVTISPVKASDMNDQQKLASAVARLLGKTLTVVHQETGTKLVPNGMINRLGGKHIYVADNTDDAPLFVAVHEAYHGLPEDKRQVLNKALLETFRGENKQAFLDEFGYDASKFDEEAPAMIAQAVSKREDFWQDLRAKMGNKEFGEVAKVILTKLTDIVTGAKKQYGDDFVSKYITDIAKARDLLSTAYAEAMQAQGLKPDVELTAAQPMFSKRVESYDAKRDNFQPPQPRDVLPKDVIDRADQYVSQFYSKGADYDMSPDDRAEGERLLAPRVKQAQDVKNEYDQKILDIAGRTGAIGQQLAPIKGIKRAVEKMHQDAVKESRSMNPDDIKDLLRSTIVVNSYDEADAVIAEIKKEFDVLRTKDRRTDAERAKLGGYADVLMNVRMPNGITAEIQINVPAMLAAKAEQGHKLYEAARVHPEGSAKYNEIYGAMRELYDRAFFSAKNARDLAQVERKPSSDMGAALRSGKPPVGISEVPSSDALKTLPSGNLTNSSPENEATNTQPGGKESGTFISGSPDKASVSQTLYASNRQVTEPSGTVGEYSYATDAKGRVIVSGDAKRIKFLTKKVANGVVTEDGVRFKGEDRDKVLAALREAPSINQAIAREVAEKLGLTPQELASTSLEYQTGLQKDKAFVAPLKGGLPEVVKFLEERRLAAGLPPLDITKPADQEIAARLIAAETLAAIRSSGNALQWYDETIARTLAMIAVKYPELQNNRNSQMLFRLAMAITSQGLDVESNLNFAMAQYDAFRKQGQFPVVGQGEDAKAMANNFALVNELLNEMGPDMLRRFLVTPFTVKELRSAGFDPEGELGDEVVLGSSVLGPKIGFGFYSNLNGNFEPVTMDMWFMRLVGRIIGALRTFDADKFGKQIGRFRAAFDQRGTDGIYADQFDPDLVELARTDNDAALRLARLVNSVHQKDFKDNRKAFDSGARKKSELVYASATMLNSADKSKDVPANGSERRQLRAIVKKAVEMVEKAHGQRIPPAAMQALVWYPEQELYKAMGVKLRVTSQDYAGAALKILKDQGYGEQQLVAAAESGSKRIQQKARRNVAAGNQAAGAAARQAGPLEGTERDRFIRERYEQTQLAKERAEPKRRGVVFEVAPDPNNAALTAAWRSLGQAQRLAISERVAREIVPRVLAELDTDGIIVPQVGSYLDDTNPSFTLLLNKGDPVAVAKALGFVLAQDSMMVVSPKPFAGGEKNSALVVEVGDKTPKQVEAIYKKLRQIKVNGEQVIGGQSYANGGMTILNYSNVPTSELAILVDQKLNKAYSILTREVFAAFPEKKEYDYASAANDGRGSRAVLRQRTRDLRAEATAALERELRDAGVQFSQRARPDATGGERDRGLAGEQVQGQVAPSYGTPREGATSAVGYHYSQQPRDSLASQARGTGLRGAEMERLRDADPRLQERIYFYIDRGTGIQPEAGVGGYAHRVNLQNLYDADEDPLRLVRDNRSSNDFELAVLDAGFDGYMVRDAGPSGNAVLLGRHDVPVEQLGSAGRMETGDVVPAARERVLSDSEAIAANKMLPAGQVSGKRWAELVGRGMPEIYARLADSPVWQSDKPMYRSELAKELRDEATAPMFSARDNYQEFRESGVRLTGYTPKVRELPAVSSASVLKREIDRGLSNLSAVIEAVKSKKDAPSKTLIGRLPHVFGMLKVRAQDFDIATSIVYKVFDGRHRDEFPDVTPREFVEAMYRPAMIFKDKGGKPREFEMVLPITNENGAVLMPIKVSVENTLDPIGAVLSLYNKRVSNDPDKPKEMTLMRRIQEGNLLYVDPALAKKAMTGRPRGGPKDGVRLNDKFLSWAGVWPTIEELIKQRRVKTDVDLMEWIGDNYNPKGQPKRDWADAPAFSKRARTDTPEFKRWFGKSVVVKRNLSFDEAKRREIDYIERDKFKPEAVKQREIAKIERMAEEQRGASSGRFQYTPWSSSREEPRVMYHATPEDITGGVFKTGAGDAIYVSPDAAHAEEIGEQKAFFKQFPKAPFFSPHLTKRKAENFPGLNVVPVYVRAENPFDYENKEHAAALTEHLQRVGYKKPPGAPDLEGAPWETLADDLLDMVSMGDFRVIESPEAISWIKQQGFDSFYMIEPQEDQPVKNLAVFSSNQLKSAIGNSGAYDLENLSINFSKRAKPKLDADVVSIFKDLDGARGLSLIRAQERVDAHPMAETIRQIDKDFLDILERLDDAGLVKINCK